MSSCTIKKTTGNSSRITDRKPGTPDAIRTHDLQSRSLTLYPAELQAHIKLLCYYMFLSAFCQGQKAAQIKQKRCQKYFTETRYILLLCNIFFIRLSYRQKRKAKAHFALQIQKGMVSYEREAVFLTQKSLRDRRRRSPMHLFNRLLRIRIFRQKATRKNALRH